MKKRDNGQEEDTKNEDIEEEKTGAKEDSKDKRESKKVKK